MNELMSCATLLFSTCRRKTSPPGKNSCPRSECTFHIDVLTLNSVHRTLVIGRASGSTPPFFLPVSALCGRVGALSCDGTCCTADADVIQRALEPKQSELVSLSQNLVDLVWTDRPARPTNKVFPLDVKYSGKPLLLVFSYFVPRPTQRPQVYPTSRRSNKCAQSCKRKTRAQRS